MAEDGSGIGKGTKIILFSHNKVTKDSKDKKMEMKTKVKLLCKEEMVCYTQRSDVTSVTS